MMEVDDVVMQVQSVDCIDVQQTAAIVDVLCFDVLDVFFLRCSPMMSIDFLG